MRKWLGIFGLLLAAVPPMPGQAIKSAAQSGGQDENHSQSDKSTSLPPLPLVNKLEQSPAAETHSGHVTAEDEEHSVKLTSLPPITLTDKTKGFWDHVLDWGPWISNALLALLGFFQVWLLLRTWKTIERQANIMERQAKDARDSGSEATRIALATAKAAQKSADAANAQIQLMKNKERAWISVEFSPISTLTFGWLDTDTVDIRVENFGFTHAHNVKAVGGVVLSAFTDKELSPSTNRFSFNVPDVVRSGVGPIGGQIYFPKQFKEDEVTTENLKWMILVEGTVEYDDVFGGPHVTRFKRYMLIWGLERTRDEDVYKIRDGRGWAKTENPEENCAT